MDFRQFTSLTINGIELVKLTRQSDGLVLFEKNLIPIPSIANMATADYTNVIPTRIVMSQYQSGQFQTSVDSSSRRKLSDKYRFYGSRGSVYLEYDIFFNSNNKPTIIQNYSQLGAQKLNYLPSDGYQITDADLGKEKQFTFTNPASDTQTQKVNVKFNSPTFNESELRLDGMNYKDSNGNIILTIGYDYVGYSGSGFETNTTFDFKQHSKEQFSITSIDGIRNISFTIR